MNSKKIFLICLIYILILQGASANKPDALNYVFADSSDLNVRQFYDTDLESYKSDKDFIYERDLYSGNANRNILWNYIRRMFEKIGFVFRAIPFIMKVILWGLVIFLIFILFTRTKLNRIFLSGKENNHPEYEVGNQEVDITDLDSAINKAVLEKNYRYAIRLLYLKVIDTLERKEYIRFSKEKTNTDYYKELKHTRFQNNFLSLTEIYNTIWYGYFEIDNREYQKHELSFNHFILQFDD